MQTFLSKLATPGKPTTEVPVYGANSFCKFGDTYLACSDGALSEFSGDDEIDAYFEFAQIDFGTSKDKRLLFMYLTFEVANGAKLEVEATPDDETSKSFTVEFTAVKSGKQTIRGKCPQGVSGGYWTFQIRNSAGEDFAISKLEAEVHILGSRRH